MFWMSPKWTLQCSIPGCLDASVGQQEAKEPSGSTDACKFIVGQLASVVKFSPFRLLSIITSIIFCCWRNFSALIWFISVQAVIRVSAGELLRRSVIWNQCFVLHTFCCMLKGILFSKDFRSKFKVTALQFYAKPETKWQDVQFRQRQNLLVAFWMSLLIADFCNPVRLHLWLIKIGRHQFEFWPHDGAASCLSSIYDELFLNGWIVDGNDCWIDVTSFGKFLSWWLCKLNQFCSIYASGVVCIILSCFPWQDFIHPRNLARGFD